VIEQTQERGGEEASAAADPAPVPAADERSEARVGEPGLRERGRLRRRLRYLRKARELALRDLGGLVFDLHRFGRERGQGPAQLVRDKLAELRAADRELRGLEAVLGDRRRLRELREPGVGGTCPSCGSLYASYAHFCEMCGVRLGEPGQRRR
jgi:hypothetical protein